MVFTVDRSSIETNGLLFLRDVLRQNLTDPVSGRTAQWVFKGPVKNNSVKDNFPIVILDSIEDRDVRVSFKSKFTTEVSVGLLVWADSQQDRDFVAQDIIDVFEDDSKTDGTNTMLSQGFTYKDRTLKNADDHIQGFSELIKIKEMDINFQYIK